MERKYLTYVPKVKAGSILPGQSEGLFWVLSAPVILLGKFESLRFGLKHFNIMGMYKIQLYSTKNWR